jgi:hypothetical protein
MDSLNVGVEAWIIQDGNYGDFTVGQTTEFALEFFPHSMKPSDSTSAAAIDLKPSRYQICGQVVYCTKNVWVIDAGFLAYQETAPPEFATEGSWVEGEVYVGIDPFMYFERLKNQSGMPSLTYSFRIGQILLETTPWLTQSNEAGGKTITRDEQNESYREVAATDAWNDDGGHAHYVFKCFSIDGRI